MASWPGMACASSRSARTASREIGRLDAPSATGRRSRLPPASARRRIADSRPRTTITTPSCSRHWPTASPRAADWLHREVRTTHYCGAAAMTENWTTEALIAEKYAGIRPAPRLPGLPDHTAGGELFTVS